MWISPRALLAGGVGGVDRRGVHGEQGEHLEQVVLEDVADGAGLLVEGARPLTPKSSAMVICIWRM